LKPGRGSFFGVPPDARMSLVYLYAEPDFVETDLLLKSTDVAVSLTKSMSASLYHCSSLSHTLEGSVMSALESFVRSMGRPSLEMTVMLPLKPCSRSFWTAPNVPDPLYSNQYGSAISATLCIPSNDDHLLLTSRLDLKGWFSSSSFDVVLRALDVHCSIFLDNIEFV